MDELRIALDSIKDKLKDLFNRVNQLEAAPTVTSGSGGGAPVDAQYLVLAFNAVLTDERRLDFSARFATLDGGAGGDYDVDLAASGVVAGGYGSATQVPQITVDTYGRITNAANVAITGVPPLAHPLLGNTYHNDVVNQGPTRGSLIYGNATPLWDELVLGGISGSLVTRNATDVLWSTGALSFAGAFTLTIPATGTAVLGTGTSGYVAYWNGTNTITGEATFEYDAGNNRLGVNKAAPSYTLDIGGKIGISGVQTIYNAAASAGYTGTIYFGNGGGSLNHTAASEAYYNTAVGVGALSANTTGYQNDALGYNALNDMANGHSNVAIGAYACSVSVSDSYNVAIGYLAMLANNGGDSNVAIGVGALSGNITGDSNVAIGYEAGRFDAAINPNQTGTRNIYIGANTRSSSSGRTNEIVIGYLTYGNGSDTTTIGDPVNTTSFYGYGNHILRDGNFVGIASDVRTVWDSTNGYIIEQLADAAGADEWRVQDSAGVGVITGDSDGNGYFAGRVGIGVAPGGGGRVYVTPVGEHAIVVNRVTGGSSIKAGVTDGYLMLDSSGGGLQLRLNNYVTDDVSIVNGGGNLAVGTTTANGKTTIDQSSTTAAIPVLELDQADLSEEMINFIVASTGAGNPVDTATAVGTTYARLRVAVNGTFKYIQLYNA